MTDYQRIEQVIRYLNEHTAEQPGLAELSELVGLSQFHFHRLFSRWAGITPKSFIRHLTMHNAKQRLLEGNSVLDAALASGLSGPGRLHDLSVTLTAASPGEIKSGGEGWTITAGIADCPFGLCLVAVSPRGICHLSFVDEWNLIAGEQAIRSNWPHSEIRWDDDTAENVALDVFGRHSTNDAELLPLSCHVKGTTFQLRVWNALLQIPYGKLASYGSVAEAIGQPGAARAVGRAVSANQLAVLIPCHRVIRETGLFGDYRWGSERKQAIHAVEAAASGVERQIDCYTQPF